MQYQLNILIDDAGLQYLYGSGQSVVIVRNVACSPAISQSTLAWVVFAPFENNVVTWDSVSYYIYASETQGNIQSTLVTQNPAQPGIIYVFQPNGITTSPGTGTAFVAANQIDSSGQIFFGLQQPFSVNTLPVTSQLNAVPVPLNQQISQTPATTVRIFSAAGYKTGDVLSSIPGNALTVDVGSGSANVGFDDATKSFIQQ